MFVVPKELCEKLDRLAVVPLLQNFYVFLFDLSDIHSCFNGKCFVLDKMDRSKISIAHGPVFRRLDSVRDILALLLDMVEYFLFHMDHLALRLVE